MTPCTVFSQFLTKPSDAPYSYTKAYYNTDLSIMTFSGFQGKGHQEKIMPMSLYMFLKTTHEAFPFLLENNVPSGFTSIKLFQGEAEFTN